MSLGLRLPSADAPGLPLLSSRPPHAPLPAARARRTSPPLPLPWGGGSTLGPGVVRTGAWARAAGGGAGNGGGAPSTTTQPIGAVWLPLMRPGVELLVCLRPGLSPLSIEPPLAPLPRFLRSHSCSSPVPVLVWYHSWARGGEDRVGGLEQRGAAQAGGGISNVNHITHGGC
jgi:hypothetical protein